MSLAGFFIKCPQFIFPTFKATETTLRLCNEYFGEEHHHDNKANAFRHALWNFMLCQHYFNIAGTVEKAVYRCKKVTDLHEELFPNKKLARIMDLHNNKIGRDLFCTNRQADIVTILRKLLAEASKINSGTDLSLCKNKLVYLED